MKIYLARILHEDAQLCTLEVVKDGEREIRLNEGDRFVTLGFPNGDPWDGD